MIGVSYQQAHKYERGVNRVSAGRLFEIARALNAPAFTAETDCLLEESGFEPSVPQ
jgi:transcriptional regulator with XRE-family HTH domain